jgi:hypothetical protein
MWLGNTCVWGKYMPCNGISDIGTGTNLWSSMSVSELEPVVEFHVGFPVRPCRLPVDIAAVQYSLYYRNPWEGIGRYSRRGYTPENVEIVPMTQMSVALLRVSLL